MKDRMAKPCAQCPFRKDVRPFLHPRRAADIAYSAQHRYADFDCHKTIEHDDDTGEGYSTATSKMCAAYFTMRINEGTEEMPEGYEWPDNVYSDPSEMVDAYEKEWKGRGR